MYIFFWTGKLLLFLKLQKSNKTNTFYVAVLRSIVNTELKSIQTLIFWGMIITTSLSALKVYYIGQQAYYSKTRDS